MTLAVGILLFIAGLVAGFSLCYILRTILRMD